MCTEKRGTVLYIGGFELPDKNAAAHRVLGIAKILKELGYSVEFMNKSTANDPPNVVEGFVVHNIHTQASVCSKVVSLFLAKQVVDYLKSRKKKQLLIEKNNLKKTLHLFLILEQKKNLLTLK